MRIRSRVSERRFIGSRVRQSAIVLSPAFVFPDLGQKKSDVHETEYI